MITTIEVYATNPADAQESARAYARDDLGLHINDFSSVLLRRPIEQSGDRFIYVVTATVTPFDFRSN
jgi:hypothetical protein